MMYICACPWLATQPEALISSRITAAARNGRPEPPYSSGISAPRKPACGQLLDELGRIGFVLLQPAPVGAGIAGADPADRLAQFGIVLAEGDECFLGHGSRLLLVQSRRTLPNDSGGVKPLLIRLHMRILFVTSNRLGDAVLSTGLLDHLIAVNPDARVTVVCGPVAEGVFARMPNRERTIVLRKQSWGRHWLPLWADVARKSGTLVVDIRGSALSWLVLTRRRAVFRRVNGPKIAQLGAILGLSPPPSPVAWTSEADRLELSALLPTGKSIIALAPTANWAPKVWPADRFAAVFRGSLVTDRRSRSSSAAQVRRNEPWPNRC